MLVLFLTQYNSCQAFVSFKKLLLPCLFATFFEQ